MTLKRTVRTYIDKYIHTMCVCVCVYVCRFYRKKPGKMKPWCVGGKTLIIVAFF